MNYSYYDALAEIETLMKKSLKTEQENLYGKWLESSTDKINQSLLKQWEDIKQSMNCWRDLSAVSKNSEKQLIHGLSSLRLTDEEFKSERKQLIFSDAVKPETDIDLIIDTLLCCIEDPNFDKNTIQQMKLKDPVNNLLFQNWSENSRPMGGLCYKRILDHQKLIEFEEAHDAIVGEKGNRNNNEEILEYFKSCDIRQFSKKRAPEFVYRIIQIRNCVLTSLSESVMRNVRTSINGNLMSDQFNEITLNNNKTIHQTILLNNLQLLRSERIFGLEPSFNLNSMVYSEEGLNRLLNRTLLLLYKENLYAGFDSNADAIYRYVEDQGTRITSPEKIDQHAIVKTQYHLIKAKCYLLKNDLDTANKLVSSAHETYAYNPKIYNCYSEILFRMLLEDNNLIKEESLIKDFFDSLYRMLLTNYQKNENKVFSMILIIFTVYAENLTSIIKIIGSFFSKLSHNFLRVHFYEIAMFFNDDVLKAIYERLCQSQLLEFYYILATFHFAVNSENQKSTEHSTASDDAESRDRPSRTRNRVTHANMFKGAVDILTNYLPRQIFMLNTLGEMAESAVMETDLDIMMYIRTIIDEAYDTGKANKHLLLKLCNRENCLSEPIQDLRQEQIPPEERFYKLIQLLDKYIADKKDRIGQKIPSKELLESNTIFFPLSAKNLLFIDTSNMFEEYRMSPTIKTVEYNDNYALSIDIFSKNSKKRKMLIMQRMNQNLIDNLMFDQLSMKTGEFFMSDPRTFENYPNKIQNLLFASNNWYCCLRNKSVPLIDIHNSYFSDLRFHKDNQKYFKEKNIALKFRSQQSGEAYPINEMLKVYPKNVLKEFLLQGLLCPEELFYFKRKLASSVAYQSFVNHAFNIETDFKSYTIDMEKGIMHTGTIKYISKDQLGLRVRLTPNFLNIFNDVIIETKIYSPIQGFIAVCLNDKNLLGVLSVVLLINENKKCSVSQLKELYVQFFKKFENCSVENIFDYVGELLNQNLSDRFRIYDKPWF